MDASTASTSLIVADRDLTEDDQFLISEARVIGSRLKGRISDTERLAAEIMFRLADLAERLGGSDRG